MSNWSVTMNNLKTCWNGAKSFVNVMPELILGTGSEKLGEAIKTTKGSIFVKGEAGWKALKKADGPFFKNLWNNSIKRFIPDIKESIAKELTAAELAGKSTILGRVKGLFKGLGQKMPLIASLSMIAFELPNIFTATKEKDIFQGGAEAVKATARLTGASIGAAIGSAAIPVPFVGSMIGWVAGEWLTGKIVGKSYTEQKEEKMEQLKQEQEQAAIDTQNIQQQNVNPFWLGNAQDPQSLASLENPQQNFQQQIPQSQIPPQQVQQPVANPYQYQNQVQFNPSMQGFSPQFTGIYNPFSNPYTMNQNFMMPQMQA